VKFSDTLHTLFLSVKEKDRRNNFGKAAKICFGCWKLRSSVYL